LQMPEARSSLEDALRRLLAGFPSRNAVAAYDDA
jgi:hypothetical protein